MDKLRIYFIEMGKRNKKLARHIIDLDVDDYEFEDGILRRIENDTTKNWIMYDIPEGYRVYWI